MTENNLTSVLYTPESRQRWNDFVAQAPAGHMMQSCEWGDFKAATGWRVQRVGVERQGQIVAGAQVLFRPLPVLPLTIGYIPKGPVVNLQDDGATATLMSALHQAARRQHAIFVKIEPNLPDDANVHDVLQQHGFRPTAHTNHPRSTIVIDLSGGEEAVLAAMRKKTRKLARRAARRGVEIIAGESQEIDDFYKILSTTAEIKGFPIHQKEFYEQMWGAFKDTGATRLLLARYQGETVAAKMIFAFGDTSMHLWGGTSATGRDVNASYLIQWEALKWAIGRGYKYSDLWGIPDEVGEILKQGQEPSKDKQHGLWGVYTFKRGFGGQVEYFAGAFDYVYRRLLYRLGMMVLERDVSIDALSGWVERLSRR